MLKTHQLSWRVNQHPIIHHIDFSIHSGETVGIVGPNGAGKTSFLKCLYGEILNFTGSVTLKNKSILQLKRKALAKQIAVVSQTHSSVFNLTVFDIVRMGLIPHKNMFDTDSQADFVHLEKALKQVDLFHKKEQTFSSLSGGEQQRLLIARAIVQSPELLIMDEPTNHLDIFYQHQILSLAKKLGITLLMTIHDLNLAAQYCDRLVLMHEGEIVADDTPEKVLTPELLKAVFKLDCDVDLHPRLNVPRVTFSGDLA
ncbi:ABC transporter ATP-binding protein [Algibacillus agarilyticus]|uniref:ABC transporter ATP-binding protein n=1 Tax=Algibacillus agarilyticus TaxID=2234133 RepID=UPI0013001819|nr:ABC transporter ATP-binding protein [Algibacillus agarilyticus]